MKKVVVLYAGEEYNRELDLVMGEVVLAFETALKTRPEIESLAARKVPWEYRNIDTYVVFNPV